MATLPTGGTVMTTDENMQENEANIPFPEGIQGMRCESDGKLYVLNEILNFYQRKLSLLTQEQAFLLAHHVFEYDALHKAKETLLALWKWKKCEPSTTNTYIIKNLETRRKKRGGKTQSAHDIIKFLQVEDVKLNITFLTMKCEMIPSEILESEAMRDIYVLMHKSEEDYKAVMEVLDQKSLEIENYANMVTNLTQGMDNMRREFSDGISNLTRMLNERMVPNDVPTIVPQTAGDNNGDDNDDNTGSSAAVTGVDGDQVLGVNTQIPHIVNPVVVVEPSAAATLTESTADEPTTAPSPVEIEQPASDNNAEVEEGEIVDDEEDAVSEASLDSFSSARSQETWSTVANRGRGRPRAQDWFSPRLRHQQEQQQQQPQQQGFRQRQQQQEEQRRQSGVRGGEGRDTGRTEETGDRLARSNYIRNNQARNMILEQGSNNIPFTAVRKMHKYELFVTNLSSATDTATIKRHISDKLGTEVFIKPMSKVGAQCLSFGLFFSSEYDNLNMKMTGLWPVGTEIYKWDVSRSNYSGTRRNNGSGRNYQGRFSGHRKRNNSSANARSGAQQGQYSQGTSGYRYRYADQQRLHDQHL